MNSEWNNDADLFALIKTELFTAVVGDVLDKLGFRKQFLPPQIQPIRDDMIVIGRAMPVLEADAFEFVSKQGLPQARMMAESFGLMLDALDDLQTGEVYICSGSSPRYALWGELMSTRALRCGATGAVVDGYSRDTAGILALNFPTFSYGRYAQDQAPRGKVIDFRCRIEMSNGVEVMPGDLIYGDWEGVLVIPKSIEAEAIKLALEKAKGEKKVKTAIEGGMSARDAWKTFGIM
jgi:regulator of RNase E activity RraA